ncbi:MAG: hypothetical protein GX640_03570 [Fibrobacter sp.]|nr:hypothetical protein [Fibrobacter sp.]
MKKNSDILYKFIKVVIILLISKTYINPEVLVFPPYGHSYGIRKATPKHLFLLLGPRTAFDNPEGLATVRLQSWEDTTKAGDDDEVVVYGVNSGRNQILYNTSMWTLGLYGDSGDSVGCFNAPKGIAADSKGNVYVADSGNNRVVHLFNPKAKLGWKKAFYVKGDSDSGLKGPSRISFDERGNVYVNDPGNRRIVVFNQDGSVIRKISSNAEFSFEDGPTALVVADGRAQWSYFDNERMIFCADKNGTRLWKLSLDGTVIKKVTVPSGYHVSYGAIDFYHNLWLTDTYNHCILKFDHNLNFLDKFGSYGTGDNQFVEPRGITIYKRFGQTFVAEKKGAQYYWIGTDLKQYEIKRNIDGKYDLTLNASEFSFLSLFSTHGTDTTFYVKKRRIYPGGCTVSVSDKESKIDLNTLMLKIEPTYSSYTYNAWFYPVQNRIIKK